MRSPLTSRPWRFRDRGEAGRELAGLLTRYRGRADVLVLGLARGGVAVAAEVAAGLDAPLDVCVVRKLGVPRHEELAMGAVASGGIAVYNDDVLAFAGVTGDQLQDTLATERRELERREAAFRGGRAPLSPAGKVVILVDDGLATGASMRAALTALRRQGAAWLVAAVPTAPTHASDDLAGLADEFVCVDAPRHFLAVAAAYQHFPQLTDDEVRAGLTSTGDAS